MFSRGTTPSASLRQAADALVLCRAGDCVVCCAEASDKLGTAKLRSDAAITDTGRAALLSIGTSPLFGLVYMADRPGHHPPLRGTERREGNADVCAAAPGCFVGLDAIVAFLLLYIISG